MRRTTRTRVPTTAAPALAAATLSVALSATLCLSAAAGPAQAQPVSPAAATAAAAPAGSLVYVEDGDVWVARPDGTDARRITSDGTPAAPYLSPSQADTGAVVAARAGRIVRMDAFGHVLDVIDPPGLTNSAGHVMDGTPSSVALSPDGSLVAYTQVESGCPVVVSCDTRFATAYTAASGLTGPAPYGVTYGNDPSWLGNDRTVQGGGSIPDVRVHVLGQPSPPRWFTDSQLETPGQELTDPTVSRDGTWVAAVRDTGPDTSILWARADGDLTSAPRLWCSTSPEPVAEPAFSADSTTLAWTVQTPGQDQGIWMERDVAGCAQPTLVVPGGSEASFSAAPFSTVDTWVDPGAGPGAGPGTGPHGPQTPAVAAPQLVGKRPALTGHAQVGMSLQVARGTWTGATSYSFTWLRNGRVINGATHKIRWAGLRDAGTRICVRVTATGPGGSTSATTRTVTIRR